MIPQPRRTDANQVPTTLIITNIASLFSVLILLLASLTTGCISSRSASAETKQLAMSFTPPPGSSAIYIIRPFHGQGMLVSFDMDLDFSDFGSLRTSSYLYTPVRPGNHSIKGHDSPKGGALVSTEAGKNYFFTITPEISASLGSYLQIDQVSEEVGKDYVKKFRASGDYAPEPKAKGPKLSPEQVEQMQKKLEERRNNE